MTLGRNWTDLQYYINNILNNEVESSLDFHKERVTEFNGWTKSSFDYLLQEYEQRKLKNAIILSRQADHDGLCDSPARNVLERSLLDLLRQALPDKDKLAIKLQKKLNKINQDVLRFPHHHHVPADNTGSERAIRNIKVKQKVSRGFRHIAGADVFAVIRSVIDITVKSAQNVFQAITLIAKCSPELVTISFIMLIATYSMAYFK